ncbi:Amidophosphoribosyltransferase [Ceratobasidium theobromae]|uniref:amidophosphoribosyltransferase n=1 Tax=Ceratobasidium theobromae TaxID=1582974 RepID=A0A5N5QWV9_9AGAM|nr:Amidophosphoribosyltransferase [Ceratobasidium theobromae]
MCGILGLLLHNPTNHAAPEICEGLSLLQHRGQDACGIVTCGRGGRFYQCKANGMVRDVFDARSIEMLVGGMGVGHVRYPTAGSSAHAEAQPFYVNSPYGIVFAHNGNLINTPELTHFLDADAHRHINTNSDSEVLLNILANNLQKTGKFRINEEDIFNAIRDLMCEARGAYACVAMLAGFGIIAFRDPNGIRPVGFAQRGNDWIVASESVVADAAGFTEWTDVRPGEAIILTRQSRSHRLVGPDPSGTPFAPDIFEYVYLARPDSVLDGVSVYHSRMSMGEALASEVRRILDEKNIHVDVVIPVPDTSRVAALELAQKLNIPYREGFVKNRYVGRTFIMPGQKERRKNVRRKLNAMALEFSGKNVLLVDDSIVRGTTSKEIVQMAKDVGAKKVIFASCAPPIRHSNVYGIDMPSRHELVAYNRTPDMVADAIGADLVIYQTLPDLIRSVRDLNPKIEQFDCSVFTGEYVTGGVSEEYLQALERLRSDVAKDKTTGEPILSGEGGSGAEASGSAAGAGNRAGERVEVGVGAGRSFQVRLESIMPTATTPVPSLAEENELRKARLLALRRKKLGENTDIPGLPQIKERNFDADARKVRKKKDVSEEDDTVEKQIAGLADMIIADDEVKREQELDLTNIAPKRPNWDLKRDLDKKLVKLERQTQRAIHTLIRQRLSGQKEVPKDLAATLSAAQKANDQDIAGDDADSDED